MAKFWNLKIFKNFKMAKKIKFLMALLLSRVGEVQMHGDERDQQKVF